MGWDGCSVGPDLGPNCLQKVISSFLSYLAFNIFGKKMTDPGECI